jgi:hypothetical protein
MKLQAFSKTFGYLMIVAVLILAVGPAWGLPDQLKAGQQVTAMKAMFPNSVQQALICTNCARLSVNICSIPGYGCAHCDDFYEYLGVVAFFDPDYWIHNYGNLPSNPGTLTVQWYDLVGKVNCARTIPIPSVPAGGEDYVTFSIGGIVVLASEGVTLTLDYSDAVATRHKARKVTKCPDK